MAFSFIKTRYWWFALSGAMIVGSLLAVATLGLNQSIDFTGGSLMELKFEGDMPATLDVARDLTDAGFKAVTVQSSGADEAIVRLESLDETRHQEALAALSKSFKVQELRFDSIGPVVGKELKNSAFTGVAVTLLLIGLYIAWAFRKVSQPVAAWKYGALTVLAAAHDVIVPLGVFAVLGRFYGWEVGTAFVAAILTILGYSISDTVVVFDRTRENLQHQTAGESFADVVEKSIQQTFVRSVNTSVTTLLALLAILVFGGDSTRPFALALFVGILVGTYSSIFIASPLLVEWELRSKNA